MLSRNTLRRGTRIVRSLLVVLVAVGVMATGSTERFCWGQCDGGAPNGDTSFAAESCSACCPPITFANRLAVRADYLLLWSDSYSVPTLVTTAFSGTSADAAGVLGQPTTRTLPGADWETQSGGRITLNYWFDPCRQFGVEAMYLGVGEGTASMSAASPSTSILARPYFDTSTGAEAAMLVAHPDVLTGSITVNSSTEFQAVEVLFRHVLEQGAGIRVDFVAGWRCATGRVVDDQPAIRLDCGARTNRSGHDQSSPRTV